MRIFWRVINILRDEYWEKSGFLGWKLKNSQEGREAKWKAIYEKVVTWSKFAILLLYQNYLNWKEIFA